MFVPVAFLTGVAQSLFLPLALAVIFAMIPSYMLSRTLVTTMMLQLLGPELPLHRPNNPEFRDIAPKMMRSPLWRIHEAIEHSLERLKEKHLVALEWALDHRKATLVLFIVFAGLTGVLIPSIGTDFFPTVDSGDFRLHVRAPTGTRLEETTKIFTDVENTIRQVIPPDQVKLILDNIGTPGALNLAFSISGTIGSAGRRDRRQPGRASRADCRLHAETARLFWRRSIPNETFFFAPADIETQILNFGISRPDRYSRRRPLCESGQELRHRAGNRPREAKGVPGAVDTYIQQVVDSPEIRMDIDRIRADSSWG